MTGRVLGIKKTYILRISALLSTIFFISSLIFVITHQKYSLWFFNFCLAVGFFELCKSFLFNLDSSLYIGFLLSTIGASGYIFTFTNTQSFAVFYIATAFATSSLITFWFSKQRFHLIFAYSLFFVSLFGILLKKSLINMPIFIAFTATFLLLLILEITIFFIRRR